MLSKATFLTPAAPLLFLAAALCGCAGPEEMADPKVAAKPASTEKAPMPPKAATEKKAAPLPGGVVQGNRFGGIAAIVGNKVISRPRLRKKIDQRILALVATQQVARGEINRRNQETVVLRELINKELVLQAQLSVYPGQGIADLVSLDNVMAFVDKEIQNRRKAGRKDIATREEYFDSQKNDLGLNREEVILEIREKMLFNMYLWEEVYGKLDTFVAPAESRSYYKSHPGDFANPLEVRYQRIKIFDNAGAFEKVQQVRQGLQEDKPFSALAMANSDEFETNAKLRATVFKSKFGALDDFAHPIPMVLKRLPEGQHAGPVRAQGALWFFRMKEIIKGAPKTYNEAQADIENKLLILRRKIAYAQHIEELRSRSRVEVYLGAPAAVDAAAPAKAPVGPVPGPKPPASAGP